MPISVPRGVAYHDALQAIHARRTGCELPLKDLSMFVRQAVHRARYERDADLWDEEAIVGAMSRLFLDNQDPEDVAAIIGLEVQAEFNLIWKGEPLACISATLDRLLCRPENPWHLVLQDHKTGRQQRRVSLQEAFLQLWCAHVRWPQYKTLSLELLWNDLEEGQIYVDVITTDMVRNHQKYLIASILHVIHDAPEAEPGPWCCWCPIRKTCQVGKDVELQDGELVF